MKQRTKSINSIFHSLCALIFLLFLVVAITVSCGGGGGGGGDGAPTGGGDGVPTGGGGGSSPTSVNLPRTGQTACFNSNGALITCTNTGQDGELRKGVAWPSPRFSANINGTVIDNLTGLIWLKNADCFSTRTWAQALTDANSLGNGSCDLNDGSSAGDWRLPNRKELRSLINYSQENTASWLNTQGFSNVRADFYWSSSTDASNPTYAWRVFMFDDSVDVFSKANTYYVWPVRTGQ